jgi:hypothetical protein
MTSDKGAKFSKFRLTKDLGFAKHELKKAGVYYVLRYDLRKPVSIEMPRDLMEFYYDIAVSSYTRKPITIFEDEIEFNFGDLELAVRGIASFFSKLLKVLRVGRGG